MPKNHKSNYRNLWIQLEMKYFIVLSRGAKSIASDNCPLKGLNRIAGRSILWRTLLQFTDNNGRIML